MLGRQSAESTLRSCIMVIVRLLGGLGNQMFQYAAARNLSIRHRTTLKLDISGFESYRLREYSLHPFHVQEEFAMPEEVAQIKAPPRGRLSRFALRVRRRIIGPVPYYRQPVFSEPVLGPFDSNIMKTPRDVYLDGYWQSEKYFADIRDVIRREFTVRHEQDRQSQEIAAQITATQSVSIHVRRGDYVSNPHTSQVHGVCGLDYYRRCVDVVAETIPYPHFFVFSDEPRWVTENLRLDCPTTFVSHNDVSRGYEDLRLMSLCKHNILANSSFGWWAAWLNTNPNKLVIAPKQWFTDPSLDARDLLPDEWIKV